MGLNKNLSMNYDDAQSVEAFQARLQECIAETGSLYAFLKLTGFPKGTIKGYLAGSEPGRIKLVRLAAALNISPAWLAYGTGDKRGGGIRPGWIPIPTLYVSPTNEVHRLDPALMVREDIVAESFQGAKPGDLVASRMADTLLSNTVKRNEWLILDCARTNPTEGGVYCIVLNGTSIMRHLSASGLNTFKVFTDTDDAPMEFRFDEIGSTIKIVGRALIVGCWVEGALRKTRTL